MSKLVNAHKRKYRKCTESAQKVLAPNSDQHLQTGGGRSRRQTSEVAVNEALTTSPDVI